MMNKMMKKIAVALTVATMTIAATGVSAHAYTQYVNNDIGLNVRVRPDQNSTRLGGLQSGDAVDVIRDAGNGWIAINYGGRVAYVRDCLSDYRVSQNTQNTQNTQNNNTASAAQSYKSLYTVNVPSGYLALRNTPCWTDNDSNVIEEMYNGQNFTAVEKNGQYWWGFSNSTGVWGYVNSAYLR